MEFWLIATVVLFTLIFFAKKVDKKYPNQLVDQSIVIDPNFEQQIIGCDGNSSIAINDSRREVLFAIRKNYKVSQRVVNYNDISSVEIFEDGTSITNTKAVGLGIGKIGLLSGRSETSKKISRIDLRLIIKDTKAPLHDVTFLNVKTEKTHNRYKQAMQSARHWYGIIEVLIKHAEEDKENVANNAVQISQSSIADEIKKLAELRDAGILNDAEFQQQKEKLLDLK